MKKLFLATVLILAIALASYGKTGEKKMNLVKNLTTALKNSTMSSTSSDGSFKRTAFLFNEKTVNAYFDPESDDLIGFAIPISANELPAGSMDAVQKKYSDYTFQDAMMFIGNTGNLGFYVSMARPKKPTIVLDISTAGKVHYYGRM